MHFGMKRKLIIVFGVLFFFVGCIALYPLQYRHHLPKTELVIDGVTREYYLFVPSGEASGPSGLIITLQGEVLMQVGVSLGRTMGGNR